MEKMIEEVKDCLKTAEEHLKKPSKISEEDEIHFRQAKEYHICRKTVHTEIY